MNIYLKLLAVSCSALMLSVGGMILVVIHLTYQAKEDSLRVDEMCPSFYSSNPDN